MCMHCFQSFGCWGIWRWDELNPSFRNWVDFVFDLKSCLTYVGFGVGTNEMSDPSLELGFRGLSRGPISACIAK
jgi:hypothetical protein